MGSRTKIPIPIPWSASEWKSITIARLLDDSRYDDFIEAWNTSIENSERKMRNISLLMVALTIDAPTAADCLQDNSFDRVLALTKEVPLKPERLNQMLEKAIELASPRRAFFSSAVEAFEFLRVTYNFTGLAIQSLHGKHKKQIEKSREQVYEFSLIILGIALNVHFGIEKWQPDHAGN